jgi:hypothetical protein
MNASTVAMEFHNVREEIIRQTGPNEKEGIKNVDLCAAILTLALYLADTTTNRMGHEIGLALNHVLQNKENCLNVALTGDLDLSSYSGVSVKVMGDKK